MDLERAIHRIAKDIGFAKAVRKNARDILQKEGYRLGEDELEALQSIIRKVEIGERIRIGDKPMHDWYETEFHDWYAEQLRYQKT